MLELETLGQAQSGAPARPGHGGPFTFSVVHNDAGLLCKVFSHEDGRLQCRSDAYLYSGTVTQTLCDSLSAFLELRSSLEGSEALMMGQPCYPEAIVVTKAALNGIPSKRRRAEQIISRSREYIAWPDGAALVMLDIDSPEAMPDDLIGRMPNTPEGWRQLAIELIPALEQTPMAWTPSSSSCLYLRDEELKGLSGQRLYFVIASGTATPLFADALKSRLVQQGLVWYQVSKSGQLLERYPFDLLIYQPERLDFAAAPICEGALERRAPEPTVWNEDGPYLEAADLPATSEADRLKMDATRRARREAKEAEARRVREAWLEERGRAITLRSRDLDPADGREVARRAIEDGVLLGDFVLTDSEGDEVTVAELLEDPLANDGRRFCDPIEPDYRNDDRIAVFQVDEHGRASVYSHAHGGQRWRCQAQPVEIRLGLIDESVDQIAAALRHDNAALYRSGGEIVGVDASRGILQALSPDGIALRLHRHFDVLKEAREGWRSANIPPRDIKALMSAASELPIPELVGVVRAPYARADGQIVDEPGYDPTTRVLYVPMSDTPLAVRRRVTKEQAQGVLEELWVPFAEFPLLTPEARGAVLAGIFTAVARPSLDIAPGYLFTASTPGTGKSTAARVLGAVHTGARVAGTSIPEREDEIRKHLFSCARSGERCLLYDNAKRGDEVDSAAIAQYLTSGQIASRVLGESRNEGWPSRMLFFITGNNVVLRGDLNRRILRVPLDAELERPWTRKFSLEDPVAHVIDNHGRLVVCALELIAAAMDDDPPEMGPSGFPDWDAVVRRTVCWIRDNLDTEVEFADPISLLTPAPEEDPEADVLGDLLEALHAVFEGAGFTASDAIRRGTPELPDQFDEADDSDLEAPEARLAQALAGVPTDRYRGHLDARELGRYLKRHDGRILNGLRLNLAGKSGNVRRYHVSKVGERSGGGGGSNG